MYLTGSTGPVFQAKGNYLINAPGCGLYVNSTDAAAMTQKGNSGSVNVASVSAVGPTSGYSVNFPTGTAVTGGVIPQTIPFTNLTPPVVPPSCPAPPSGKLTASTGPGCYSGTVNIGNVTLSAGTYIFTGNVTISGSVTGLGVAFYMASTTGSFTVKPGNATIDLTPPTSSTDPFNGVFIYMPLGNATTIGFQAGSSSGTIGGFIVAPGATFQMQDNGGSGMTIGGLVVNNIDDGPAQLNLSGYSPSTSPLKNVTLVE